MATKPQDLVVALRCSALQSIRLAYTTGSLSKEDAVIQTQKELERIERATNSLMSSIVAEIKEHWSFLLELVEVSLAADNPFGNFSGKGQSRVTPADFGARRDDLCPWRAPAC